MFRKLQASWMLTKACLRVLQKDKELMLFPVFCLIFSVLAAIGFGLSIWAMPTSETGEESLDLIFTLLGLAFSFVTYSIVLFFNVAVLSCAKIRFQGGDPTLADGFRAGFANLKVIFMWAAFGGLVSFIIRQLEESLGIIGSLIGRLLGGAFAILSYFAIPVMIFEKVGPTQAFTRSKEIIKKSWGEALGAYLGFSIITTIAAWSIIFGVIGSIVVSVQMDSFTPMSVGFSLALVVALLAGILSSCLSQIFQAALYIYATTGEISTEIGQDILDQAFLPRQGRKWVLPGV